MITQSLDVGRKRKMYFISVIIPVYNAEKTIRKCVESLLNQNYPKNKYEIIIVDNNSTDDSIKEIKHYPVKIIKCEKRGAYIARNTGAKHAKGEILAFTDADCEASENWLAEINNSFNDINIDAVQGPGNKTRQKDLKVKVECLTREMTEKIFWGDTKNFAIRKRVFDEIGGFDSFFTGSDAAFLLKLREKGYIVKFNDKMIVYHEFPTDFLKLIRKNWRHGFGDVYIEKNFYKVRRLSKIKKLFYTNVRRSFKIFSLNDRQWRKTLMWIYYFIAIEIRTASYIFHSFHPKILFASNLERENKVRVAYVLSYFPKLSHTFIMNEIVELIKKGHEVYIFPWSHASENVIHEEVVKYKLMERTYFYLSKRQLLTINPTRFLSFFRFFTKLLAIDLKKKRLSKGLIHRSAKLAYFASIIKEKKVSLIHAHFATMGEVAKILGKLTNLPYSITVHAYDIYSIPFTQQMKDVLNNARMIITISNYNKDYLKTNLHINTRIEIVRCGINLQKFNPDANLEKDDKIRILAVGRLVEKKGIEYLIRALPIVLKELSECELIIIGSGPLYDQLEALVKELNLENIVRFEGNVSDSDLLKFYESADIFVLPCIIAENGDRDGIPVSIMEAMAMKLPVVSTNVSGIPELVENNVSGILVKQKDTTELANAIVKLGKNQNMRKNMGEKGRQIVESKFNLGVEVEKLIELFQEVKKIEANNSPKPK